MKEKDIIKSQYAASLEMFRQAVKKCPGDAWNNKRDKNRFWHICYHALFYTHLYLQTTEGDFIPWEKHREEYPFLGKLPWPPHADPKIGDPYSKEDILEYAAFCLKEVEKRVDALDLESTSGFHWLPFDKLELQFYNIRHIQHHAGQLIDRLRNHDNIGVDWVGAKEF